MRPFPRTSQPFATCHHLCLRCSPSQGVRGARAGLQNRDRIQRRAKGYIAPAGGQARPLEGFYAELLTKPPTKPIPGTKTIPAPEPPDPVLASEKDRLMAKARQVFGLRIDMPEERRKQIEAGMQNIAGVMVPPKPEEPDNCCMSGCVHCVWDMYRDEMEEWAAKSTEARTKMRAHLEEAQTGEAMVMSGSGTTPIGASMDDDGGGSESNWSAGPSQEELFENIPLGIREFMKLEKDLKQRHRIDGTNNL